jgi:cell shape-determining protein MreC
MADSYQKFWPELGIAAIIFIVMVLGEWLGMLQPVVSFFEHMLQPAVVQVSRVTAESNQPLILFRKSFGAARRVQELELEYSRSLAKISELEYLEQENQELRRLFQAQEKTTRTVIAAPIVSHGQPSISAGQDEGVLVGQPVLVAEVLVGLVKSTTNHQSIINLLFQNSTQPILVKTESGVEGLIVGNGKNILLTEISKEAEVAIGERVITVGQEQIQPQLVVGRVQQLIDQPSAPIKQAVIYQEASFYEASIVEVLP